MTYFACCSSPSQVSLHPSNTTLQKAPYNISTRRKLMSSLLARDRRLNMLFFSGILIILSDNCETLLHLSQELKKKMQSTMLNRNAKCIKRQMFMKW